VRAFLSSKWAKVIVFLLGVTPLGLLGWRALNSNLTANPIEYITHFTGDWTIRFLIFTLCITPFRKLLRFPELIRFRRMLGLFAFSYVCLHFLTWLVIDQQFNLHDMWADVLKRRFITVGFTAFVLLIPLAVTSTAGWIRRLGGKRWQQLHRAIYVAAVCGVIHYYWLVKSDIRMPLFYGTLVGLLLLWRLFDFLKRRSSRAPSRAAVQPASVN